jgi:hypothetical protein
MRMLINFFKKKSDIEAIQINSDWLNYVRNQWETIRNNKKLLAIFLLVPLMLILLFTIVGKHKYSTIDNVISAQNKHSEAVLRELTNISETLHEVSNNTTTAKQQVVLQSLEKEIMTIHQSIVDVAKGSDIQKMSNQITLVKEDMDSQISDLKKSVYESSGNKQYISESALPFHVISVDVIAGQSYVSVDYANHTLPLAISDLLAGWRVISADYDSGVVDFVNEKNQYVKVSLQGV